MIYIYTISCAKTGRVVYVGRTKNPKERFYAHKSKPCDTPIKKWVATNKPVFEVIDSCDFIEAKNLEEYWIHQMTVWGFELFNNQLSGMENKVSNKERRMRDVTPMSCGEVIERLLNIKRMVAEHFNTSRA